MAINRFGLGTVSKNDVVGYLWKRHAWRTWLSAQLIPHKSCCLLVDRAIAEVCRDVMNSTSRTKISWLKISSKSFPVDPSRTQRKKKNCVLIWRQSTGNAKRQICWKFMQALLGQKQGLTRGSGNTSFTASQWLEKRCMVVLETSLLMKRSSLICTKPP